MDESLKGREHTLKSYHSYLLVNCVVTFSCSCPLHTVWVAFIYSTKVSIFIFSENNEDWCLDDVGLICAGCAGGAETKLEELLLAATCSLLPFTEFIHIA